jgi:hypothetical protein
MSNYAPVSYTGTGSQTDFAVPFPYLDQSHVQVYINDVLSSIASWPSAGLARLSAAPLNGTTVTFTRETVGDQLVTHAPGFIKTNDLNTGYRQSMYLADEAKSATGILRSLIVAVATAADLFFTIPLAGGIARRVRDRFGENLSVADFGAVTSVGAPSSAIMTANTTAFNQIITYTKTPFLPAGDFWINGNLSNFRTVEFWGPGRIRRLDSLTSTNIVFAPESDASVTNTFFTSATGNDINDGLTSDLPSLTPQNTLDWLATRKRVFGYASTVKVTGNYATNVRLNVRGWKSRNAGALTIEGPAVAVNAQPLAVFSGTTANDGLAIGNTHDLNVNNIEFKGFDANVTGNYCRVFLTNVWATNGNEGYFFKSRTYWDAIGGVITGQSRFQVHELFSVVRHTTGAEVLDGGGNIDYAASRARGLQIRGATGVIAWKAKEHCTGHMDYTVFTDCGVAIYGSRGCTFGMQGVQIYRSTKVGIALFNGSQAIFTNSTDLGYGTGNSNARNWRFDRTSNIGVQETDNASLVDSTLGIQGAAEECMASFVAPDNPAAPFNSTTSAMIADLSALPAGSFQKAGTYIRVWGLGTKTGANGVANLQLKIGGSLPGAQAVVAADATRFEFVCMMASRGMAATNKQFLRSRVIHNGTGLMSFSATSNQNFALDGATDFNVQLWGNVTAGDTITIDGCWAETVERRVLEN